MRSLKFSSFRERIKEQRQNKGSLNDLDFSYQEMLRAINRVDTAVSSMKVTVTVLEELIKSSFNREREKEEILKVLRMLVRSIKDQREKLMS